MKNKLDYLQKYVSKVSQNKKQTKIVQKQLASESESDKSDNKPIMLDENGDSMHQSVPSSPKSGSESSDLNVRRPKNGRYQVNVIKTEKKQSKKSKIKKESSSSSDEQNGKKRKRIHSSSSEKSNKTISDHAQVRPTKTVFRNAEGAKIDPTKLDKRSLKQKLYEQNEEQIQEWSKGLVQQRQQFENNKKAREEKKKNFISYDLDKEAEMELMQKARFGDTMQQVIQKEDKKKIEAGQWKNIGTLVLQCKFPGVSNRFGIKPGFRWDGVDRGNSFENKYFKNVNQQLDKANIARQIMASDL